MGDITIMQLLDWAGRWVLFFSVLSIILPPVEFFDEVPRFQKWYRFICKFIKYFGSLDVRGKVIPLYPSFQNAAVARAEGEVKVAKAEEAVADAKDVAAAKPEGGKDV